MGGMDELVRFIEHHLRRGYRRVLQKRWKTDDRQEIVSFRLF